MKENKKYVKPKYGTKSRSTAMILAVFFSFWSWLYTYRENGYKFWIGLIICLTCWWLFFIPNIAIWIWAMVDNNSRSEEWYEEYNQQ